MNRSKQGGMGNKSHCCFTGRFGPRFSPPGRRAAANENPPDRTPKSWSPSANTARTEAFPQGLRELGYVEGKNIVIERRSAEGRLDRLPELAAELVRLKVESSSRLVRHQPAPPRRQLLRFPLS